MSIFAYKNNLIIELFVRTADENYIAARWCAVNQLNTDFLWLSVHALEKYLKAVLLINGHSAKRSPIDKKPYGHDVVRLYKDVKVLAGTLLPDNLLELSWVENPHRFSQTPDQFMRRLLSNGNADNRYLIYGYNTFSEDLYMLDAMVFSIRRLICSLDEPWLKRDHPEAPTFTHREFLAHRPDYYECLSMPLDNLISAREETPKRAAALNLNVAFAPKTYRHEPPHLWSSSHNPVIVRRILDPLKSDNPECAAEGIELARWFLENVQVPRGQAGNPGVTEQIMAAIECARFKHGIQ